MAGDDDDFTPITISHTPITAMIQIGDTKAAIGINAHYSPDIIDDIITRLTRLYATTITIATDKGFTYIPDDTTDDDYEE